MPTSPPTTAAPVPTTRPARVAAWPGLARRAYWPVILGLVALNAWWAWDARPLPDLKEVALWVAQERDRDARSASWWDLGRVPHNNDGAIAVLRRAVRHSPNDGEARSLLGRALGAKGEIRAAAEQLRAVPFWSPLKPESLLGEGYAWLEIKRARDAELAFLAYLRVDPNHRTERPKRVEVRNKLLDLYAWEDRWDEARDLIWRSYREDGLGPMARRGVLELSLRTRLERSHPSAALPYLREFAAADPGDWNARRALARVANAEKLFEESDREIRACLAANPTDPKVWGDRLEILRAREDFDGLAAALAEAPPGADADPRVPMARGRVLRQAKDHAGAARAFAKAVALTPSDPDAHNALALASQLVGRVQEAEAHRRRHAELEALTKEIPEAVNAYKDASESVPVKLEDLKNAMLRLSVACRGMGWPDDAEGWAKSAGEL